MSSRSRHLQNELAVDVRGHAVVSSCRYRNADQRFVVGGIYDSTFDRARLSRRTEAQSKYCHK